MFTHIPITIIELETPMLATGLECGLAIECFGAIN